MRSIRILTLMRVYFWLLDLLKSNDFRVTPGETLMFNQSKLSWMDIYIYIYINKMSLSYTWYNSKELHIF